MLNCNKLIATDMSMHHMQEFCWWVLSISCIGKWQERRMDQFFQIAMVLCYFIIWLHDNRFFGGEHEGLLWKAIKDLLSLFLSPMDKRNGTMLLLPESTYSCWHTASTHAGTMHNTGTANATDSGWITPCPLLSSPGWDAQAIFGFISSSSEGCGFYSETLMLQL
jgi:hypothetical protein